MENNKEQERDKARNNARTFGGIVYVGGVVAATVLFITFILMAFPPDAYFSRVVMTLAAVAVGCSMLAFPIALHDWVVTKDHRFWGVALYYGEMAIIAVNTVVSFVSLLAEYTGYVAPAWTVLYEPFSVISILYTVCAWGTLFLLDPQHKEYAAEQEAEARLDAKIAKKREAFLDTEQGEALTDELAAAEISERWTVEGHLRRKGLKRAAIPAPQVFIKKEAATTSPLSKADDPEK